MKQESRLFLVEHERHALDFLARHNSDGEADKWIALGPGAMSALDRRGIRYGIPEDFLAWSELQQLTLQLTARTETLCDVLDDKLLLLNPDLKELGIRPFQFSIVALVQLFHALGGRLLQLRRVFEAHAGYRALIHAQPSQSPRGDLGFSSEVSIWASVAALIDSNVNVVADAAAASRKVRNARLKNAIRGSVSLTSVLRLISLGNYRELLRMLVPPRGIALVVDAPADWVPVIRRLGSIGLRPRFVLDRFFGESNHDLGVTEDELDSLGNGELRDLFTVEGLSFYPLVAGRIAAIWRDGPSQARKAVSAFARLQRRREIRLVLRGSANGPVAHAANRAAMAQGIKVCTWQHGMVTTRDQISQSRDYADAMTSDLVLAYGRESSRGYRAATDNWPHVRVVEVGSARLDAIRARSPKRPASSSRVRILYATTNYYENDWYLGFTPGVSDRLLYRDQLAIIASLRDAAKKGLCEVAIKLHPNPRYTEPPWVEDLRRDPWGEVMDSASPFQVLVESYDAVVLDLASTTLLQALAAGKNTFVLMRYLQPSVEAEALLRRSAVARPTVAEVVHEIDAYLGEGAFPANPDDVGFLTMCGLCQDDGLAADRALGALRGLSLAGNPWSGDRLQSNGQTIISLAQGEEDV